MTVHDIIGALAGLTDDSSERIRGHRPGVIAAAESSLQALFDVSAADEAQRLTRAARLLVAARTAQLDGAFELAEFYLEQFAEEDPAGSVFEGPSGFDPATVRDLADGGADAAAARTQQRSIRVLLRHVDLLVQRPAAATSDDLDALTSAGWSVVEVVVLSQIISFVTYQTRAIAGLRVLQEVGA